MKVEIEFSTHAHRQLITRPRITKSMVLEVLRDPDEVAKSYRGRKLYRKRYQDEWLEIVVVKEDNKLIVVTQYFLEQQS